MIEILQQPFFQNALMAGIVVALMCSFLGVYVLLKRVVFVGFALSHIASAGVAFALLLGTGPLIPALAFTLGGVAFFSQVPARRKVPMEGVIGASYILAAAVAIICVAKYPVGEARTLRILFGNILSVETGELVTLALVFILIAAVHFLFYKEFLFVSFDFETAQGQGLNARFWNLLLYLTLGIAIAAAIRSMGVLLVFAFLVAPPITARLLADRMERMFLLAMAFGALSVPIGLYFAFVIDLPTG
ncbi:MAG: metal ABC transporter permease, partial [Candidatus Tectimicrobiota bacterium]